ncbi:MAG: N-acetyltransferase family protein [Candidatus Nanohaloarchaea archaeon]
MKLRHADRKDAEQIREVAVKSWHDAYSHLLPDDTIDDIVDRWYSVEQLKDEIQDPVFYVAVSGDRVIGFVHATVKGDIAELHRIYLDPEYQRKGFGSALLGKAEEELRPRAEKMELEVLKENKKGISFYRKKGFRTQYTETAELSGEEVEQKVMEKEL